MNEEWVEYPDCTEDDFVSMNEIKHAQDHFRAVLDILYGKRPITHIQWHLQEIASVLDLEDEINEINREQK